MYIYCISSLPVISPNLSQIFNLITKVAKRLSNSARNHATKRRQIADDCRLIRSACPNLRKLNVVLHHKVETAVSVHSSDPLSFILLPLSLHQSY